MTFFVNSVENAVCGLKYDSVVLFLNVSKISGFFQQIFVVQKERNCENRGGSDKFELSEGGAPR